MQLEATPTIAVASFGALLALGLLVVLLLFDDASSSPRRRSSGLSLSSHARSVSHSTAASASELLLLDQEPANDMAFQSPRKILKNFVLLAVAFSANHVSSSSCSLPAGPLSFLILIAC
jgi:hypothetical protein